LAEDFIMQIWKGVS